MRLLSILFCVTVAGIGIEGFAVTSKQHPHAKELTIADSKVVLIFKI